MKRNLLLVAIFIQGLLCYANTDRKIWKLKTGESLSAVLVDYRPETKTVILKTDKDEDIAVQQEELNSVDQEWVVAYLRLTAETQQLVNKLGGTLTSGQSTGNYPTGYHIYRPSTASTGQLLPLMILFHPSGKGDSMISRHIEASEASGFITLALDVFRNTSDGEKTEGEFKERFSEVWPFIKANFIFDPSRVFMGGCSGGAWRAYHYASWFEGPWAGIYANGGWLGGKKYENEKYPPLRVAMVNGHQDTAANFWVESDRKILEAKCGGVVKAFAFEGAHQIPPVIDQIKAFEWLKSTNAEVKNP